MPKQKIRKSVTKRFRVTKSGKVLARHAFRRHLSASKSKKRLSSLKRVKVIKNPQAKKIKKYLGK